MDAQVEQHAAGIAGATEGAVLAEMRGSVALLTLNRPEKLNAWGRSIEERYFDLLDEAERSSAVRAIVVTGAGRGFCVGADFDDLKAVSALDLSALERRREISHPLTIRKPLVAAINGPAAGVGLVQALYCDVRVLSATAKLTTAFARRGLIAEYGSARLLTELVGRGAALDLLLSGRVVMGEEALALGLVNRLAEPGAVLDSALAYAADLAENCSPTAMSVIKRQVGRAMDGAFADSFAEADEEMRASFARPDVEEGVESYLQKRPPSFAPLEPRAEETMR